MQFSTKGTKNTPTLALSVREWWTRGERKASWWPIIIHSDIGVCWPRHLCGSSYGLSTEPVRLVYWSNKYINTYRKYYVGYNVMGSWVLDWTNTFDISAHIWFYFKQFKRQLMTMLVHWFNTLLKPVIYNFWCSFLLLCNSLKTANASIY